MSFLDVERVLAEHLARRELDEALHGLPCRDSGLEGVVGADHVDAHRADWAREHGVDSGDPRRVDEVRAAGRELREPVEVEDVALGEAEVRVVGEVGPGERVAMEVVDRDDLVRVDEPGRERRPDEPGAAGDEDPLSRQGHPRIVDAPGGGIGGRGCRAAGLLARSTTAAWPLLSQPAMSQPVTLGPPTSSPRLKA